MPVGDAVFTFFNNQWENGNTPVLGAADHATWLGTLVFDGARKFDGVTPDLDSHCERVNQSAIAMGLEPTLTTEKMVDIAREGLENFASTDAIYIRPMYWSKESNATVVGADPQSTQFAMCLERVAMPNPDASMTLTTTSFCRPMLSMQMVNTKAACLYPHNARMLREVNAKGFNNAIVCDVLGNVAETATSNLMMAKDGEVFTPVPNGTFLNGITRKRISTLLRDSGTAVHEATLSLDDFRNADEIFATGNISKVTPVTQLEDKHLQAGPIARQARELYWDWAATTSY